jgi:hypothetical protein
MRARGRQPALDETIIARLVEWIDMRCKNHQPITMKQTRLFMAEMCEISIAKTTLHEVVQQIPQIHTCSVSPMDTSRLSLNDEDIYTWFIFETGFDFNQIYLRR